MVFHQIPKSHQDFIIEINKSKVLDERAKNLFAQSLIHRSFAVENSLSEDNERLEFLGDAVLDLTVASVLFENYQDRQEGFLSKRRAAFVNEETLTAFGISFGIDKYVLLGKGEKKSGGDKKPSIISSTLEAWLGANFLVFGYEFTSQLITQWYFNNKNDLDSHLNEDFKSKLQEFLQSKIKVSPSYTVESEMGPDHSKMFEVGIYLEKQLICKGVGPSKKKAEREAARLALQMFQNSDKDKILQLINK